MLCLLREVPPWPAPRSRPPAPSFPPTSHSGQRTCRPQQARGTSRSAEGLWPLFGGGLGGGAIELGVVLCRESIFKISHTKSRRKVQNLDPRPDVARTWLHLARWVYEGRRAEGAEGAERAASTVVARCGVWYVLREVPTWPLAGAPEPTSGTPLPTYPGPRAKDLSPKRPAALPGALSGPGCPLGEAWEVVRSSWAWFCAASRFLKFPILNRDEKFRTWTLDPMWRARVCIWLGGSMKGAERPVKASEPMALGEDVRAIPGRLSRRSESC